MAAAARMHAKELSPTKPPAKPIKITCASWKPHVIRHVKKAVVASVGGSSSSSQGATVRSALEGVWLPEDPKLFRKFLEVQGIWGAVQKAVAAIVPGKFKLEFCGEKCVLVREGGTSMVMSLDGVRRPFVALPSAAGMGTSWYVGEWVSNKHAYLRTELSDKEVSVEHHFVLHDDGRLQWTMRRGDAELEGYFIWSPEPVPPTDLQESQDGRGTLSSRTHVFELTKHGFRVPSNGNLATTSLQPLPETKVLTSTPVVAPPAGRPKFGTAGSNGSMSSNSSRQSSKSASSSRTSSSSAGVGTLSSGISGVRQRIQQSLMSCLQSM
mmetsp:Transcript_54628/g.116735  ORF Transcript_54628/g.116735 Transcript_54628/m.116735 type:complete len:324 (-) Transcript_54628:305-1276(-)